MGLIISCLVMMKKSRQFFKKAGGTFKKAGGIFLEI
jgi:hypothetical protein